MNIEEIKFHHTTQNHVGSKGIGFDHIADRMVDWLISEHDRLTAELDTAQKASRQANDDMAAVVESLTAKLREAAAREADSYCCAEGSAECNNRYAEMVANIRALPLPEKGGDL